MASLLALTGGGVKRITRYTFSPSSSSNFSQSTTITAVDDLNKTQLNLLTTAVGTPGTGNGGSTVGIRLANTTTVEYSNSTDSSENISFEVIEYL